MERSKSFALIFLLGAFIAGGALGITADRVLTRDKHSRGRRPSVDRMASELKLTPAQRTQFDSIASDGRSRMRELWRPLRPQMDSVQKIGRTLGDSTHEQLKRILTADQARKLDEMRERGRKRAEARRRSDTSRHQQKPIP